MDDLCEAAELFFEEHQQLGTETLHGFERDRHAPLTIPGLVDDPHPSRAQLADQTETIVPGRGDVAEALGIQRLRMNAVLELHQAGDE